MTTRGGVGGRGRISSRGEDRDRWPGVPSLQPDQEILPKIFQEGALRRQGASGPPLQCKDCKLRCLPDQANGTHGDVAVERGRPVQRVDTTQFQPDVTVQEGQDSQFFTGSCKSGLIFKRGGKSINVQARFGSRAMGLTPPFHSSPLILQMGRVLEGQKRGCPREGCLFPGPCGAGRCEGDGAWTQL